MSNYIFIIKVLLKDEYKIMANIETDMIRTTVAPNSGTTAIQRLLQIHISSNSIESN